MNSAIATETSPAAAARGSSLKAVNPDGHVIQPKKLQELAGK